MQCDTISMSFALPLSGFMLGGGGWGGGGGQGVVTGGARVFRFTHTSPGLHVQTFCVRGDPMRCATRNFQDALPAESLQVDCSPNIHEKRV